MATSFSSLLGTTSTHLTRNVVWYGGHNFTFFHGRWFGRIDLLLQVTPEKKSHGVKSHPIHNSGSWPFSHSRTTVAKCGGARSCMKIKSSIFSQVLKTAQISSLCIVRYLSAFTVSRRTHNRELLFNHPVYSSEIYMLRCMISRHT